MYLVSRLFCFDRGKLKVEVMLCDDEECYLKVYVICSFLKYYGVCEF